MELSGVLSKATSHCQSFEHIDGNRSNMNGYIHIPIFIANLFLRSIFGYEHCQVFHIQIQMDNLCPDWYVSLVNQFLLVLTLKITLLVKLNRF